MQAKYLIIGAASSIGAVILTWSLLILPWEKEPGAREQRGAWDLPWLRLLAYFPWLLGQIVIANFQIAWVVLHPRLPIDPQLVSFRKHFPTPIAYFLLGNSITLTPGTVTVDLEGDEFLVHALIRSSAEALKPPEGEGDMIRRIERIFAG